MSGNTSLTVVDAPFAGKVRRFQLRLGEIGELERLCHAGIGGILVRLSTHQFYAADIWETIRLGLEGGGTPEIEATALVTRYHDRPIADYIGLASSIISACVAGVDPDASGNGDGEGTNAHPATSPPSTGPEAPSVSTPAPSTG